MDGRYKIRRAVVAATGTPAEVYFADCLDPRSRRYTPMAVIHTQGRHAHRMEALITRVPPYVSEAWTRNCRLRMHGLGTTDQRRSPQRPRLHQAACACAYAGRGSSARAVFQLVAPWARDRISARQKEFTCSPLCDPRYACGLGARGRKEGGHRTTRNDRQDKLSEMQPASTHGRLPFSARRRCRSDPAEGGQLRIHGPGEIAFIIASRALEIIIHPRSTSCGAAENQCSRELRVVLERCVGAGVAFRRAELGPTRGAGPQDSNGQTNGGTDDDIGHSHGGPREVSARQWLAQR